MTALSSTAFSSSVFRPLIRHQDTETESDGLFSTLFVILREKRIDRERIDAVIEFVKYADMDQLNLFKDNVWIKFLSKKKKNKKKKNK